MESGSSMRISIYPEFDDSRLLRGRLRLCENRSLRSQSKFRLLVVRLGAMGDILHALPAVTALRMAHPEWQIDWVVEPMWRGLLAAESSTGRNTATQPLVDRIHFACTRQWRHNLLAPKTRLEIGALHSA